jgi:hypothetical protein
MNGIRSTFGMRRMEKQNFNIYPIIPGIPASGKAG